SVDNASSWLDIEDIPTTQMYRVVYNPHFPDRYYGGAQDNGSSFGNVSTLDQWVQYFDGDGFRTIFHPDDPNLFYVETQLGGLSVTRDGGKTFERATKGIDGSDNINWDAPVIMSHFNPDVLYYGTDRVYRNSSGADENFVAISDKLTDPVVLLDATSNITAMEESPMNDQVLFAGTGDGNLYRTLDLGQKWEKADAGLPDRYITSVVHSSELESVVYVTHSGYKAGEELPHIHRSDDQGGSWTDISGDLPSLPINDVFVLENHNDQVLFAATDGGVYFTLDAGIHWIRLGSNMPIIPVFDLEYNPDQNTLIAGTHAKSIMTFDLTQEGLNGVLGVDTKDQHFNKLAISPNPVEDYLKFELDDFVQDFDLKIFDQGGRIILESKKLHDVLDVSFLNPGVYYLVVHGGNESHLGRFIKL
ncbi:MAG: T9SS type A sorting domain-containing protein, partial [Saprospiraceae bacterium]|nr:T9SS type A sorting domain-containing protein [Saprospiraceae bacterium]